MRKTLGVCLLTLLLTVPASAGLIPNDTPAPPPPSTVQEPTGGEMQNGYIQNGIMPNEAPNGLTQIALELLAVLPSLL